MDIGSVILWGFVASIVVTSIMEGAQGLGISRISLPLMLGTFFSPNRNLCTVMGFFIHLLIGWTLSIIYAAAFESWGAANLWLGMLIGLVHGSFTIVVMIPAMPYIHPRMATEYEEPTPTRMLEPPGFLALNYGRQTPIVTMIAHLAFGAILGGFYK